jgi:hypothetical protein
MIKKLVISAMCTTLLVACGAQDHKASINKKLAGAGETAEGDKALEKASTDGGCPQLKAVLAQIYAKKTQPLTIYPVDMDLQTLAPGSQKLETLNDDFTRGKILLQQVKMDLETKAATELGSSMVGDLLSVGDQDKCAQVTFINPTTDQTQPFKIDAAKSRGGALVVSNDKGEAREYKVDTKNQLFTITVIRPMSVVTCDNPKSVRMFFKQRFLVSWGGNGPVYLERSLARLIDKFVQTPTEFKERLTKPTEAPKPVVRTPVATPGKPATPAAPVVTLPGAPAKGTPAGDVMGISRETFTSILREIDKGRFNGLTCK